MAIDEQYAFVIVAYPNSHKHIQYTYILNVRAKLKVPHRHTTSHRNTDDVQLRARLSRLASRLCRSAYSTPNHTDIHRHDNFDDDDDDTFCEYTECTLDAAKSIALRRQRGGDVHDFGHAPTLRQAHTHTHTHTEKCVCRLGVSGDEE